MTAPETTMTEADFKENARLVLVSREEGFRAGLVEAIEETKEVERRPECYNEYATGAFWVREALEKRLAAYDARKVSAP